LLVAAKTRRAVILSHSHSTRHDGTERERTRWTAHRT